MGFYNKLILKRPFKITAVAILLSFMHLFVFSGSKLWAQQSSITLKMTNVPIKEVLNEIEKTSNYGFLYQEEIKSQLDKRISIDVSSKPINSVLTDMFKGTALTYKLNDRQIIISLKKDSDIAEEKSIMVNGQVMDENYEPLPGVGIVIKGTASGTTTDVDGKYQIRVPNSSSSLVFSYIGHTTQEINVGKQININVVMKETSTGLNEVVVVGYGTQKRASVVGAITTLEPKRLQMGTTRSLTNNLAGQVAGVLAVQRSGEPGHDAAQFWIRGISTFQGAGRDPLVLIDGIERNLSDIDPAEIESFSILKDAAASAVYGVRGANGVVLVNTKRGEIGKPRVNVRIEQSFTQPVKLPNYIGSAEYLTVLDEINMDKNGTEIYGREDIAKYRNGVDRELYPDVNWLEAISNNNANNSRVNMTVSGGSNILRYALVASYFGETGIIKRDPAQAWDSTPKLKRYNIRSNVDVNITSTTLLGINIGGYLLDQRRAPTSVDELFNKAFETTPFVHPTIYSTGEIPKRPQRSNPWAMATQTGFRTNTASKIESVFFLEQDLKFILSGLKAKGIFSFDRYSASSVTRGKTPTYYDPATGRDQDGNLIFGFFETGQEFLGYSTGADWGNRSSYLEGNITYSKVLNDEHYIDGMLLYNQRKYEDGSQLPYLNQGFAGRASYRYQDRYIAEFNFGYNGSENFARGKRFGFFPSVALGWLLSEEYFMESVRGTLSKLKFRVSHGLVGNDRLEGRRFAYITTIDSTPGYQWGEGLNEKRENYGGYKEGDVGVEDLTWEKVTKSNLGIELGLWNELDLQVDLFKERRSDIFMQRSTVPTATGLSKPPWANYGKVNNEGIDASLNYTKQITSDFAVGLRATFTYARNEIVDVDESLGKRGTNLSREGHPVGQIFGLEAIGLFTEDDFIDVGNGVLRNDLDENGNRVIPEHTFTTVRPGDIKYKDADNNGYIDSNDYIAIGGTIDPQVVYGFGATFMYKQFDLSCFFQGLGKTYRIIGGDNFIPGSANGAMGNILSNVSDRWTKEAPSQDVFWPRLDNALNENNKQASTWWLQDMSMVRLKDLEMGYSIPNKWTNKLGLSSARIFARGTNLLTFSDFKLWDPELDTGTGSKYPIMKSFSFGLDFNF